MSVKMRIRKTVVGSFPAISGDLEESIRRIVDMQLQYGLDIISDGEQRADMITYFKDIPGLGLGVGGLRVCSKIMPPKDPAETNKVKDFIAVKDYLEEIGRGDVTIKTTLTGPITLGVACGASGISHYSGLNDMNLYLDLSRAIESIAIYLLELGSYVQIDEPGLSAGFMAPSKASPILEELFRNISKARKQPESISIHVCGDLNGKQQLVERLLKLNLDIVSLAFSGPREQGNLDLISKDLFTTSRKKLGAGCVSVSPTTQADVEGEGEIYMRLKKISERIGGENLAYAHPDCGLRNTPVHISKMILQRLSLAVDRYNAYFQYYQA
ncbi:MAG: hypothetical protein ACUVTM_01075 [Candidatus Bathyarchaeia archaeon]